MPMPTTKYTDLATYLRKWGLKVQEVTGWQTRSSNWYKTFAPRGVVVHHTAGPVAGGNYPSYNTVLNGREGLEGPLSQFGLGRDGTVYLFGGHRANHAGVGGPLVGIPEDSGNAYLWGIEAENSGTQAWPTVQLQAYYRLCAALAAYDKAPFPITRVIGHKEWAPYRKVDPGGINMDSFRSQVQKAYNAGPKPPAQENQPAFDGPADGLPINSWSLKYATQGKGMNGTTLKDATQFVAFAWSQKLVSNFNLYKYHDHLHLGQWAQASEMFTSIMKSTQRKFGLTATGVFDRNLGRKMAQFGYRVNYNG
jgi:hypothetical protein